MRTEVARELVEATGQPGCVRHVTTRSGDVVPEWVEAVPLGTMPPLSRKCEGISFGSTQALGSAGDPPLEVEPCPGCGRTIWDYDFETPARLVYSGAAAKAMQRHAVVAMYEPFRSFPTFDPKKGVFKDLYGFPFLLFNRAALRVLVKHTEPHRIRDGSSFEPVYLD